ncbi:MAG TPA: aldo/keto reductase [Acidimicrobiales bacterium]|nr:aldo/keto reductase [Acidimicrobiales bacterium]
MIARAPFGRTGHESSRVLFGAAALSKVDQQRADEVLSLLLPAGVNHIDTAASYGESELRLAPFLKEHRDEFFVASKTGERTGEEARRSLERSLERLGIDQLDLIQLHNLVEEEEWAVAHGPGGAVEALARARDEGLVRFIGVTGHGLRIAGMHLRSLERFAFDSVLLPFNFPLLREPAYREEVEALLDRCAEGGVAVQTIKSIARRRWPEPRPEERRSWYQPLGDAAAIGRAVRFVLGRPQLFLNSSSDFTLLPLVLEAAAAGGGVPADEEMEGDVDAYEMAPLFDGEALERI